MFLAIKVLLEYAQCLLGRSAVLHCLTGIIDDLSPINVTGHTGVSMTPCYSLSWIMSSGCLYSVHRTLFMSTRV